jgi:hypothetical protein
VNEVSGRNLLEGRTGPITQSIAAIKALLSWKGRASDPLPQFVELGKDEGKLVLVLSNKRDAYYCVTPKTCSCPAQTWHPGTPCKHQRKHFPEVKTTTKRSEPLIKRGGFKSFDEMPGERAASRAASSSFCMVDTTPDATPREIAYHSIREDKIMWPVEA